VAVHKRVDAVGAGCSNRVEIDPKIRVKDESLIGEDKVDAGHDVGQMIHGLGVPSHSVRHRVIRKVANANVSADIEEGVPIVIDKICGSGRATGYPQPSSYQTKEA